MSDCLFCKIIAGEIPAHKVYEDDKVFAFLDIHPVNPGHALVIAKNHAGNLEESKTEDVCAIMAVIHKLAPKILKAVGAEAFNLGLNNGRDAGQIVPHLHFHIMPRFPGDGHALWHGQSAEKDELAEIAKKIRKEPRT
ncbi:HIT family protein [Candidatus Uhrbacteria bacterium]|nr:HIT family protein [Candidatus Uhrbacteria bacterium]